MDGVDSRFLASGVRYLGRGWLQRATPLGLSGSIGGILVNSRTSGMQVFGDPGPRPKHNLRIQGSNRGAQALRDYLGIVG